MLYVWKPVSDAEAPQLTIEDIEVARAQLDLRKLSYESGVARLWSMLKSSIADVTGLAGQRKVVQARPEPTLHLSFMQLTLGFVHILIAYFEAIAAMFVLT